MNRLKPAFRAVIPQSAAFALVALLTLSSFQAKAAAAGCHQAFTKNSISSPIGDPGLTAVNLLVDEYVRYGSGKRFAVTQSQMDPVGLQELVLHRNEQTYQLLQLLDTATTANPLAVRAMQGGRIQTFYATRASWSVQEFSTARIEVELGITADFQKPTPQSLVSLDFSQIEDVSTVSSPTTATISNRPIGTDLLVQPNSPVYRAGQAAVAIRVGLMTPTTFGAYANPGAPLSLVDVNVSGSPAATAVNAGLGYGLDASGSPLRRPINFDLVRDPNTPVLNER